MIRSFDFDDTLLAYDIDRKRRKIAIGPNFEIVEFVKVCYTNGDEIILVTARRPEVVLKEEIEDFLHENDLKDIVTKTCYTSGGGKAEVLLEEALMLGHKHIVHYDDDEYHIAEILSWKDYALEKGITIEAIRVLTRYEEFNK
jgi:hypothetical protein